MILSSKEQQLGQRAKAKLEALNEKLQALAVKLYEDKLQQRRQAQAGQKAHKATSNAGDDVVDGEFTEK